MKLIKLKLFTLLAVLTLVMSCSIDENENTCFSQLYAPATEVTGPSTTTVNTPITLNVSFTIFNSCGTFNRIDSADVYPKEIAALIDYNGCECDNVESTIIKPYVFQASAAGEYELRFLTLTSGAPIVRVITVTEE